MTVPHNAMYRDLDRVVRLSRIGTEILYGYPSKARRLIEQHARAEIRRITK